MKKKQSTGLLLIVPALTLCVGFVEGMIASRVEIIGGHSTKSMEPATLVSELHLAPAQRDQMRTIWERVQADTQDSYRSAQNLQRQRDQAVVDLLDDDQRATYARIAGDYASKFTALSHQRDEALQTAIRQTRQLLDDNQRKAYERILSIRQQQTNLIGAMGIAVPIDVAEW